MSTTRTGGPQRISTTISRRVLVVRVFFPTGFFLRTDDRIVGERSRRVCGDRRVFPVETLVRTGELTRSVMLEECSGADRLWVLDLIHC